ncbi:MAG: TrmH family RNA methyltransferase [Gammaproteobacteria bacterium]
MQQIMVTNTRYQRIVEMLNRRQPDLTMIMDGVHKTHNLAAIARTCDAVGIGWIHAVSPDGYLHLGHKRASGTEKWVAVASHANIEDAYRHLKREGFTIVAAVLRADALEFDQIDYTRPTAIAVGNELDGLSGEALDGADACVRIPVQGAVESLNVSVATALILYEAMRQRRAVGFYERRRISDEDFTRLAVCSSDLAAVALRERLGEAVDSIITFSDGYPARQNSGPVCSAQPQLLSVRA